MGLREAELMPTADARSAPVAVAESPESYAEEVNREEYVKILEKEMADAAESLDFERAALLRDQLDAANERPAAAWLEVNFQGVPDHNV